MIPALIAGGASILVAVITTFTRKAVKQQITSNSSDHAMVVEALRSLDGRVGQMHDMIYEHITDSDIHNH